MQNNYIKELAIKTYQEEQVTISRVKRKRVFYRHRMFVGYVLLFALSFLYYG
ncbi:hypothetical protein [Vibrio hangzhouensis]|uniref:Uncharacterized protein n=1 Tax=Vibrio hangzhouensis TaxID=462991 RepID=A0A1H5W4K1_9VIBR|nr:hypothetical protein [Vibrio hangzhouensis]SEF94166.1 hypothetical protein SAMN04488244_105124 [Vibrio hangzhouensis]